MSNKIDVKELRSWLAAGRPVTLLDVRTDEQRADWYIPGSRHEDLYSQQQSDESDALDDLDLPTDRPVVVVCAAGRSSVIAADRLGQRGYQAFSLEGGMKAWSTAWNTASVSLKSGPRIVQVRRTGKGCLSYLLISNGEAIVIDAALDPHVFLSIADDHNARIVAAADTHVHADHLSRSRGLARHLDVPLLLPAQDRVTFPYTPIHDDDRIPFGSSALEVLRTPGHTWESSCYYLPGEAVFTGDTLFVDSVGRPDLEAGPGESAKRAEALYESLRRLDRLPDEVLVLPGHSSAPLAFDDEVWGARLAAVRSRTELLRLEREAFVERVTTRIPQTPENHQRIVQLNEAGELPDDTRDLEAGGNRCAIG